MKYMLGRLVHRKAREGGNLNALAKLLDCLVQQVTYSPARVFNERFYEECVGIHWIHSRNLHRKLAGKRAKFGILGNKVSLA